MLFRRLALPILAAVAAASLLPGLLFLWIALLLPPLDAYSVPSSGFDPSLFLVLGFALLLWFGAAHLLLHHHRRRGMLLATACLLTSLALGWWFGRDNGGGWASALPALFFLGTFGLGAAVLHRLSGTRAS